MGLAYRFNSPESPDSSHNACAMSTQRVRIRYASPDHSVGFFNAKKTGSYFKPVNLSDVKSLL